MDFLQFRHRATFAAILATLARKAHKLVPTVIDPWHSAGNGFVLGTNYGVPNLTVTFMGKATPGASPNTDQDAGLGAVGEFVPCGLLTHQPGRIVGITPNVGWPQGVSLFSFDLGSVLRRTDDFLIWQIWNGDYSVSAV